ncbi:MAG: hypothetical protein P8Y13_01365 [Deinococcales bacterium]
MMEDASTGHTGIRTATLAIVLAALTSWVTATGGPPATAPSGSGSGPAPLPASLSFGVPGSDTLTFVPMPGKAPTPQGALRLPPEGGPITLIADLQATGTYVLSVRVLDDIVDAATGAPIPATAVHYATQPIGSAEPPGCQPSGWRSIGGGSRVAVLHGPGVCRLRVRLSWSWGPAAAPGHYHGALRWTLSSAGP